MPPRVQCPFDEFGSQTTILRFVRFQRPTSTGERRKVHGHIVVTEPVAALIAPVDHELAAVAGSCSVPYHVQ